MAIKLNPEYVSSIDEQIKSAQEKLGLDLNRQLVDQESSLSLDLRQTVTNSVKQYLGQTNFDFAAISLSPPPKNIASESGCDYALSCFELSKAMSKNPVEVASELTELLNKNDLFVKVEPTGPYINLWLNPKQIVLSVQEIIELDNYSQISNGQNALIIIDYSSPNVAKPFGINHLSSTVLGEALSRLAEKNGYIVLRDNHIGDWGTQFGNLLAAYNIYQPAKAFTDMSVDELNEIYIRFSQDKKTNEELVKQGQTCFSSLESGDETLMNMWYYAVKLSQKEFDEVYTRLGIKFDTQVGEGYLAIGADQLVNDLPRDKLTGLVVYDDKSSAVYIDGDHPVIIRTSDGYCVYGARDLETIAFRMRSFKPKHIHYVVGEEQSSYFNEIFKVAFKAELTKLGDQITQLKYIGFGLLLDKDGKKLSTRKGTSGKLTDLLDQVKAKAIAETKTRNPDLTDIDINDIAEKVAIGAVIWNNLKTDRISSVRFDIDSMLSLGGGSVIDILYTYSRSCSILNKFSNEDISSDLSDIEKFSNQIEHALALKLTELPEVIRKAYKFSQPHLLTSYLQDIAAMHGNFYETSRVIGIEDDNLTRLRVNLHKAYIKVISISMELLNIPLLEKI